MRQRREQGGGLGFQVIGFAVFLAGFGMGITSLARFVDEEGPDFPALESQRPLYQDANPYLALALILIGVILIALGSGRRD